MAGVPGKTLSAPTAKRKPMEPAGPHRMGRPPKKGPKTVRKTDITLPPALIEGMNATAKKLGLSQKEYGRLAVQAYAKYLVSNPVTPMLQSCPECERPYTAFRSKDGRSRLRVGVHFDDTTNECMLFVADTFYHGTFSHAFEASVVFYMTGSPPPPPVVLKGGHLSAEVERLREALTEIRRAVEQSYIEDRDQTLESVSVYAINALREPA